MSLDFDAIDAALRSATPILAATVWPVLAITAGVALWWRGQDDPEVRTTAPKPPTTNEGLRRLRPPEAHTQPVPYAAWSAGTPIYAELAAQPMPAVVATNLARTWLAEFREQARTQVTA
ncbi:hypothetical protein JNW90_09020 [Micromonospora sp. STR1s_5]|nr:hypothetical protein [Micromonospora sp. STR1s_5]